MKREPAPDELQAARELRLSFAGDVIAGIRDASGAEVASGAASAGAAGVVACAGAAGAGATAGGVPVDFMKPLSVAVATTTRSSAGTLMCQVAENTDDAVSPALAFSSKAGKPRFRRLPSCERLFVYSLMTLTGFVVTGPCSPDGAPSPPLPGPRPAKIR